MIHWQIDNGHGGIIDGEYVTAPKKMFTFNDGFTVLEGVFNRSVVSKLSCLLSDEGISFSLVVDSEKDVPLRERRRLINERHENNDCNTVLISVHGNAGKGTGFEVFTTRGETTSDTIATVAFEELEKQFPETRMRMDTSDGDVDKEANFTILMCRPPAILTENLFFDNRNDAEIMMSDEGQNRIAIAHFNAIKKIHDKYDHISKIK